MAVLRKFGTSRQAVHFMYHVSSYFKLRLLNYQAETTEFSSQNLVMLLWYFLFQAENVTVTKDIRRVENAYHMEAEVCND